MQVDDITVGIDTGFESTVNSVLKEFTLPIPILHGAHLKVMFVLNGMQLKNWNQSKVTSLITVSRWKPIF